MNEKLIRRVVTWGLIAGAMVIVGGLGFALWRSFSEGPRPDTSDLEPVRIPVPANENGFAVLSGSMPLVKAEKDWRLSDWRTKKWDQTKVDLLLTQNEKALALLDKALAMRGFQFEKVESFGQRLSYLSSLQDLARVKAFSALTRWDRKQQHAAIEENFQLLELGHRIENGGGGVVHFLVGVSVEVMALNNFPRFVCEAAAPEREELKNALSGLEPYENHVDAFSNGMKVEFTVCRNLVDDFSSGKQKLSSIWDTAKTGAAPMWPREMFQPNNTLAMFAVTYRRIVADAALPYSRIDLEPGPMKSLDKMSSWEKMISPNATGRAMYLLASPSMAGIASKKCRITTTAAMTRALIAVRLYWLDHGKLPDTLSELVPAYLASVPADDYDGKPLRYSPSRKVIYSVGKELTDRGGDLSEGNMDGDKQPTVKIGW